MSQLPYPRRLLPAGLRSVLVLLSFPSISLPQLQRWTFVPAIQRCVLDRFGSDQENPHKLGQAAQARSQSRHAVTFEARE